MDQKGLIGAESRLPWRLSADLRRFKALTMGKPIVMGRKTHESIGRPLPGRVNVVISTNPDYQPDGCLVCDSLASALRALDQYDEVFIIGGTSLFEPTLALADRIYLTEVHAALSGDTWFPPWDRSQWRELERSRHPADECNQYAYSFVVLERASDPEKAVCSEPT
jgi:dihydrofolate reductase